MADPSSDATLGRMLLTFLVLALLSAAGVAVGRSYSSDDMRSADAAFVDSSSPVVAAPVTTAAAVAAVTESSVVITSAAPTTTLRRTTTVPPTTTLPPPPVYKLYEAEGVNVRFNPCQNPITILFNPVGYLDDGQVARVEAVLIEQAAELSVLTGMNIVYGFLTDEVSQSKYKYGEKILIHVGMPGEGLIAAGDDYGWNWHYSWDRTSGGFREVDAVQAQINADVGSFFDSDSFDSMGRKLLMFLLGAAMGLNALSDADMVAAGSTDPAHWDEEIMYRTGLPSVPTWGPGDRAGLAAVGAVNGCF
ncbi:MAG: hypothetical protein WCC60_24395 [Ilumatobacteraceae bacterium]